MNLRRHFRKALLGISLALAAVQTGAVRTPDTETIPYANILQTGSAADHGIEIDSNVDNKYVANAFRRAQAGEDVITPELVAQLTNYNVKFNRGGDQATANSYDFSYSSRHLFQRPAIAIMNGTAMDKAAQEKEIAFIAQNFGAPDSVVRKVAADWEKYFTAQLALGYTGDPVLDRQLARNAFGQLSPQEEAALGTMLDAHADRTHQRRDIVHKTAESYEAALRFASAKMQDKGVAVLRTAAGTTGRINGGEVEVPDYAEAPGAVMKILYPGVDRPARTPPGTASVWEFLFTMHESEHVTQLSPSEFDADTPVMRFLANKPELREYYLQWRQVTSFRSGPEDGFSHDTATALRLWQKTGRAVDMEKLAVEKGALIKKVDGLLDGRCIPGAPDYCAVNSAPTGDIMGAVAEILRDDKTLTAIQRAQGEMYLHDATALGYTTNTNFPHKMAAPSVAQSATALKSPKA